MKKFSLEERITIYNEFYKGKSYQSLAKKYGMNYSNLRYMIKYVDRYGWEEYKNNNFYSDDLKESMIKKVLNNEDSIFNIALDGGLKSRTLLQGWVQKYKENGYNIVERKRGWSAMLKKPKQTNKNDNLVQENERLKKENEYLKAELEYSKKLRAVVQARKNQQQKKK